MIHWCFIEQLQNKSPYTVDVEVVLKEAFSYLSKGNTFTVQRFLAYYILYLLFLFHTVSMNTHFYICLSLVPLQEECAMSDPQGESDADADIEDTDCRFDVYKHIIFTHRLSLFGSPSFIAV